MEPKQHHTQQQQQSAPQHPDQHQNNAHLDPHSSQWQFGLFDCCGDMKACLLGCCLPCVLHGKTMQRMHDPSLPSHELLNHECMVWCCIPSEWLYNTATRTRIREKYGIEGDASSDFKTSYFCTCCALIQQDREVALRAGHYPPPTPRDTRVRRRACRCLGIAVSRTPRNIRGIGIIGRNGKGEGDGETNRLE